MINRILMKGIIGVSIAFINVTTFATSIEGYWKSIDDRTSEQLAIVEIRKVEDGTYSGKTVYIYPSVRKGADVTHCVNCPPPYTNKPRLGLEFMTQIIQDPKDPNNYINGKLLDPATGKIYKGKAHLSSDGKRLKLRGYIGVSMLGRSIVWIRTNSPNP